MLFKCTVLFSSRAWTDDAIIHLALDWARALGAQHVPANAFCQAAERSQGDMAWYDQVAGAAQVFVDEYSLASSFGINKVLHGISKFTCS